ncbi:MAG: hypothetical protein IPH22_10050 [Nitrosomonas sp.]|nr:hypothetical protein [Nitrosomonas sp.]
MSQTNAAVMGVSFSQKELLFFQLNRADTNRTAPLLLQAAFSDAQFVQ